MNEDAKKRIERMKLQMLARAKAFWEEDGKAKKKELKLGPDEDPLLAVKIEPKRYYIAFGCITAFLCVLVGRAFYLQCGLGTKFLQHQGEIRFARTLTVPAVRGRILDRNGIVLASTMPARSVWVVPAETEKATPQQLAELGKLLGMPVSEIQQRIARKQNKSFAYLHRQVEVSVANQVKALKIPGVHVSSETRRQYPDGQVSAHVVGYTNLEEKGQEGIELAQNKMLTGEQGKRRVIRDRMGRIVEDDWLKEPSDGKDITLSIDSRLQFITMDALSKAVELHKAKAGAAIVVDIQTGEILALANVPSYDPNERSDLSFDKRRNRALTDVFEPGSAMKPFAVAKGIDTGVVTPDTKIDTSPGKLTIGNRTISDTHNYGLISVRQVIAKSSNIGTTKISLKMDREVMYQMYRDLGFGTAPHIGFPGAASGILRDGKTWQPIEQATISYGLGVAVSLVQLVRAYTAFARNGMMMGTVEVGGTAVRAQVPGYSVAGKTGTAYKLENGRYVHRYVADFIGIAPATNPRVIVAVVVDDPREAGHVGGVVAAPVFSQITESVLRIMHVAPDRPDTLQGLVFAKEGGAKPGVVLAGGHKQQ